MSADATSVLDGTNAKPKSFQDYRDMARKLTMCQRCGGRRATHTISVTAAKLGERGIEAQIRRVPTCEQCGVEILAFAKKALKA